MQNPKALIFDVFGTIVDWRSGIAAQSDQWFERKNIQYDSFEFADLWRNEYQSAMQRIRHGGRGYVALDTLHRENLDFALDKAGLNHAFSTAERDEFAHAWEYLPPWPDSVAGLTTLKQHRMIAPCSNGSIALMTRLAKFGKLPWDCILGADIANDYKPKPQVYLKSCTALGLLPGEVMMVAAHNDDLVAARQAGLQCAFILRPMEYGYSQERDLEPTENWDFSLNYITELPVVLGL